MLRLSASLLLASLLALPACSHRHRASEPPTIEYPDTLDDLDDYAAARNAFALLELGDPAREPLRAKLRAYLIGYVGEAIDRKREDSAVEGIEQLVDLWSAREQAALAPDPEIAQLGARLYDAVAPAGHERSALLALAIMQAFGSAELRAEAETDYAQLREWIARGAGFSPDPRFADEHELLLEDVDGVFPSPWVTEQLTKLYLERLRRAQQGEGLGLRDPRVPFTGYLLARAYLRADRLDECVATLDRLQLDESTLALRDMIASAAAQARGEGADPRSTGDLDQLAIEFVPASDSKLPESILRQSWGIVDNLAGHSLARVPGHAPAMLARGRVLRAKGLLRAAIVFYERALASKTRATHFDDLHRAYLELASLHQAVLEHTAEHDVPAAEAMLPAVEDFHRRARVAWPQRPIQPTLSSAWLTVALALYESGEIGDAEQLLDRAIAGEPQAGAYMLLATIEMRRGEFGRARKALDQLERMSFEDQLDRYDWEIRAAMLRGEIELLDGKRDAARRELGEAREALDVLLAYPGLDDGLRVEFLARRTRVLLRLGEIGEAMEDFRDARVIAPTRVDVYAGPLTFVVSHGYLGEATEIFEAALTSAAIDPDLLVYFSLWLSDLAQREGSPVPAKVDETLRSLAEPDATQDPWAGMLARHGLGELEFDTLLASAKTPRQHAEAYFYEGLRTWRAGQRERGLDLMRKVIEANMMGDFEYEMAQSYLMWKELPRTARAE